MVCESLCSEKYGLSVSVGASNIWLPLSVSMESVCGALRRSTTNPVKLRSLRTLNVNGESPLQMVKSKYGNDLPSKECLILVNFSKILVCEF